MTNKLTLTEQEELFAKDCKLINLKYEYNGYTGDERWAIITELSVKELWEKYPLVIERYSPFVHLSIAQGEVINDANRNEDKYAKRSSRTLDCYGYDDEMSSQFHKELAIMFDDPFERAEEEWNILQVIPFDVVSWFHNVLFAFFFPYFPLFTEHLLKYFT